MHGRLGEYKLYSSSPAISGTTKKGTL